MPFDVCLSHTPGLSREQRGLGTDLLTEVAHVTRDSDTTFKVKVTRPLCSPLCCQAAAAVGWECVVRGKLLLRCRLLGSARRPRGSGAGAYRGGNLPTACLPEHVIIVVYLQLTIGHATAAKYPHQSTSASTAAGIVQRTIAGQQTTLPSTSIQTVKVVE